MPRLSTPSGRVLSLFVLLALLPGISGCALGASSRPRPRPPRVLHLAAIFPATGVDGSLGRAVQRGVELALRRNVRLAARYRLALTPIDESAVTPARLGRVLARQRVVGVVGPLEEGSISTLLPAIERRRIVTISPLTILPNLPARQDSSAAGQHTAFFPWTTTDSAGGKVAADLATSPTLGARTVFVVDDGSLSGRALAGAFAGELVLRGGAVAGWRHTAGGDPMVAQRAVSAIIESNPDLVFYAGGTAGGAALRRTLTQTGAPLLRILTVGPIANHPGWAAAVGGRALAARTLGLFPAPAPSSPTPRWFLTAYHRAFPREVLLPQTVFAYDSVMDEIAAIRALIRAGKPVTPRAVAALIAGRRYAGITGPLTTRGTGKKAERFSLFTCDLQGVWQYRGAVA